MSDRHPTVAALARRARELDRPALAVEAQWGTPGADTETGRWQEHVEVCLIVVGAGWSDSRYHARVLTRLPGADRRDRERAGRLTRSLAGRLGLPCGTAALDSPAGTRADRWRSAWMAARGPAPSVDVEVHWDAEFWLDDAVPGRSAGVETVTARGGRDACDEAARVLAAHLGSEYGPVGVRCTVPALYRHPGRDEQLPATAYRELPPRRCLDVPVDELRALWRAGKSPAQVLRAAREHAGHRANPVRGAASDELSPVALMWLVHRVLGLSMAELSSIGGWQAGTLSAVGLNEVLSGPFRSAGNHSGLPGRIEMARRVGGSVAAVLRSDLGIGWLLLARHLWLGFDETLSLTDAVRTVEALATHTDAEIDAMLPTGPDTAAG
ncbi:MAG: hypothetical protein WCA46_15615 [Actinocatenispora sp.]